MEIKYEAVFGDQSLFDCAPKNAEIVRYNNYSDDYVFSDLSHIFALSFKQLHALPIIAMRRIIRTPTWTVADQKAGKLPEVGAKVDGGKVVFVNSFNVVTELESGAVIVSSPKTFLNTFKPIESPEEKAERLREEWIRTASLLTPAVTGKLISDLGFIYDSFLSGDLPVPVKGK